MGKKPILTTCDICSQDYVYIHGQGAFNRAKKHTCPTCTKKYGRTPLASSKKYREKYEPAINALPKNHNLLSSSGASLPILANCSYCQSDFLHKKGMKKYEQYDQHFCPNCSHKTRTVHGQSVVGERTIEYNLLSNARRNAKKKGVPINITIEDIVVPEFCPVLGFRLEKSKAKGPQLQSPTLDRIIPELGYVKGNVAVISHRANRIKSDAKIEEILQVAEFLKKHFEVMNDEN